MEAKKPNTKLMSLGVLIAVVLLVVAVTALNKKDKDDTVPATDSVAQVQAVSTTSDATATSQETSTTAATTPAAATQPYSNSATTTTAYKAGTYTASGSYVTPESNETIKVSLTLDSDGTISAATVSQSPQNRDSQAYQQRFANNYKASVVGKNISTLKLGNISGSSLTPIGFNKASASIESTAKA